MSTIGIIGGSGLYEMPGLRRCKWITVKTPFGEASDQYLTGQVDGRALVFLPRHGRGHCRLPSELNHRANIWGMKKLGASVVISVSAVGSLKQKYRPTDIVLIDQFFDRTKQSANHTYFGNGIVGHVSFADPVCMRLRQALLQCGRAAKARVHDGGTYVNMEGPAFSTRAESMFHRKMGWDVIGMTNLGEARCAREASLCYATLAMVTDYDCWHQQAESVTVEMVIENLNKNCATAQDIIRRAVRSLDPEIDCSCHHALEGAVMTNPAKIPAAQKKQLALLLGC